MIFLVISGAMLGWSVVAIGQRQRQVQFSQEVRGFESRLRDIANDVATGFIPYADGYSCVIDGSPSNANNGIHFVTGGPDTTGTNRDCIFLGKVIQMGVQGSGGAGYDIFTVLGRRQTPSGAVSFRDVQNFDEAKPTPLLSQPPDPVFDMTDRQRLLWGVRFKEASTAMLGFFPTFAASGSRGLESGTFETRTVAVPLSSGNPFALDRDRDDAIDAIRGLENNDPGAFTTQGICLERDDSKEFALLTVGTNGRNLDITTRFRADTDAVLTDGGVTC